MHDLFFKFRGGAELGLFLESIDNKVGRVDESFYAIRETILASTI